MSVSSPAPARLRAARVLRVHGVRGEVRVEPLGGDLERFPPGTRLYVEGKNRSVSVRSARSGNDNTLLLGFSEIDTPESARQLLGTYLCVDAGAARRLGDNEWFVWQLVGLDAITPEGEVLGDVVDVEPASGNDVLVVRTANGMRRFPMVRDFVADVSLDSGRVTVTPWPEDEA
jgi:16S rRNA processing protein RimM